MTVPPSGSFSAPQQTLTFDGLLSDFDGTIVDSTAGELSDIFTKDLIADLFNSNC